MEHRKMSFDEKIETALKAVELSKAGDREGYMRLMKTLPMLPHIAKVFKDKLGLDSLLNGGFNLSEVEEEFGAEWLKK